MSRIYTVTDRALGTVVRYVRANTLNAAVRAAAAELFEAVPTTTEEMFQAAKGGPLDVLDAVAEDAADVEAPKIAALAGRP